MNRNIVYITDSSLYNASNRFSLYSIVSLCGTNDYIEYLIRSFNDIFNGTLLSIESFHDWYELEENSNILLDFLSKFDTESSSCRFISYLSDHNFLKFLLYLSTLFKINDNMEIMKEVDIIYKNFDKTILQCLDSNITESKLTDINRHTIALLKSLYNKKLISKNISQSRILLENQIKHVLDMGNTIFKDMSVLDYVNYSLSLMRFSNNIDLDFISGIEHSIKQIDLCLNNLHFNKDLDNEKLKNRITLEILDNNILLNNIIVIFDYAWNKLHNCISIDTLSKNDKQLIIYLWLLFQSDYSNWMLTSIDFDKIKSIFNEFNSINDNYS